MVSFGGSAYAVAESATARKSRLNTARLRGRFKARFSRPREVPARTPSRPGLHLGGEAAEPIHLDAHQHPLLAGLAIRVLVHAEEALSELIEVRVGARFRQGRGPVDDHVRLKVVP